MSPAIDSFGDAAARLSARLASWFSGLGPRSPAFVVGGAVRDVLLNREASDIDLASPDPEPLARLLADARGAALVPLLKDPRVPCYRVVSRRNPEDFLDIVGLRAPDILADLADRDFTINAMAITLGPSGPGEILDPTGGRADIASRLVRRILRKNLEDDPLRILRGHRFAAQLDFSVEPETAADFAALAPLLERSAAERKAKELLLLLASPRACREIRAMAASGVLFELFPELRTLVGVTQNEYHHEDVWNHSLSVLDRVEAVLADLTAFFGPAAAPLSDILARDDNLAVLKLSALFHDAGKPAVKGFRADTGSATFYGHEKESAAIAARAARRLRLSRRSGELLSLLAAEHIHGEDLLKDGVKEKTKVSWLRRMGDDAPLELILVMADALAKAGPRLDEPERKKRADRASSLANAYFFIHKARFERKPLLSGRDLMALGLAPGPGLGEILAAIQEARDAGLVANPEEALTLARSLMK